MDQLKKVPKLKIESEKGFTLVETLFVAILLPIMFLSLYGVIDMANTIFQTNTVFAQFNQNAMQSLRSIGRELGETSALTGTTRLDITTDEEGNSIVDFQIPVDWDNDGDVYSGTLTPITEWGAYHNPNDIGNAELEGWTRYFVTEGQLVREVFNEDMEAIEGTARVVSNNVESFQVTKNGDRVTMQIEMRISDDIGRKGQAQSYTWNFSNETFLRNSVS